MEKDPQELNGLSEEVYKLGMQDVAITTSCISCNDLRGLIMWQHHEGCGVKHTAVVLFSESLMPHLQQE
jgi:hypothetical protein